MNPAASGLLPQANVPRDYRTGAYVGSVDHYRQRMEDYATQNDALRQELDEYQERDARRCAFLRGLNG